MNDNTSVTHKVVAIDDFSKSDLELFFLEYVESCRSCIEKYEIPKDFNFIPKIKFGSFLSGTDQVNLVMVLNQTKIEYNTNTQTGTVNGLSYLNHRWISEMYQACCDAAEYTKNNKNNHQQYEIEHTVFDCKDNAKCIAFHIRNCNMNSKLVCNIYPALKNIDGNNLRISSSFALLQDDDKFDEDLSGMISAGSISDSNKNPKSDINRVFKLLTYNIFLRPPLIRNNESDYKDERTRLFMSEMKNFDVIAFQEAFSFLNTRIDKIISEGKRLGFSHHVRGPPSGLFSIDGGLLILSKFQIVRQAILVYSKGMAADQLAQKGSIYALIRTPEGTLFHLFNTHLQASYNDPSSKQKTKMFEDIKKSQLEELVKFVLLETTNDNLPILLVGDLNINARNKSPKSEYEVLQNLFEENFIIRDLLLESYGEHPITISDIEQKDGKVIPKETALTAKIAQGAPQCLDYIFLLKKKNYAESNLIDMEEKSCRVETFFVQNQKLTQLSDHYGISVDLNARKPM